METKNLITVAVAAAAGLGALLLFKRKASAAPRVPGYGQAGSGAGAGMGPGGNCSDVNYAMAHVAECAAKGASSGIIDTGGSLLTSGFGRSGGGGDSFSTPWGPMSKGDLVKLQTPSVAPEVNASRARRWYDALKTAEAAGDIQGSGGYMKSADDVTQQAGIGPSSNLLSEDKQWTDYMRQEWSQKMLTDFIREYNMKYNAKVPYWPTDTAVSGWSGLGALPENLLPYSYAQRTGLIRNILY